MIGWSHTHKNTRENVVVLRVELTRDYVALAMETQHVSIGTSHIERLWDVSIDENDNGGLHRYLYASLAQITHIDAVLVDQKSIQCDAHVALIIDLCLHFVQLANAQILSMVLCVRDTDPNAASIERLVRHTARTYASHGVRLNMVYTHSTEQTMQNVTVRYLLTDGTHHMSGAVMDAHGKILLGSMLSAERMLVERSIHVRNGGSYSKQNSA
jgi:hypothetical protein